MFRPSAGVTRQRQRLLLRGDGASCWANHINSRSELKETEEVSVVSWKRPVSMYLSSVD
jgi:hypothetical protein